MEALMLTTLFILAAAAYIGRVRHSRELQEWNAVERWRIDDQHRKAGGRFADPGWYIPTIRNS
ncbi:hypothetical protein HY414_02805 [Candidatus Kaiserbacteria bacterium]|nr:hypothetical protein [Candidatus Kaiserbacteria bacterium]